MQGWLGGEGYCTNITIHCNFAILQFYKVKHFLFQVVFGREVDKMSQVREDERRE